MNRLRELREKKGYTQEQIAEKIDCNIKTYRDLELENTEKPYLIHFTKLADIYNCSIDYLLGKSNYRNADNEILSKEIGLNNQAIQNLRIINRLKNNKDYIDSLNLLLSDSDKLTDFLISFSRYINIDTSKSEFMTLNDGHYNIVKGVPPYLIGSGIQEGEKNILLLRDNNQNDLYDFPLKQILDSALQKNLYDSIENYK